MSDFLEKLLAHKMSLPKLKNVKRDPSRKVNFLKAISRKVGRPALIAEIKHATPTIPKFEGDIVQTGERARRYCESGASAMSVVVEPTFFKGSFDDVKIACPFAPVLCKGFFVTKEEIDCAAYFGASAVLLITALSGYTDLFQIRARIRELGLAALVEVHEPSELETALRLEPDALGINRRNLKTLKIDSNAQEKIIPLVPPHIPLVVESHIRSSLTQLPHESSAALVGTFLMEGTDIEERVRTLVGPPLTHKIVKLCGLRSSKDFEDAKQTKCTHMGVNLIAQSKRYVPVDVFQEMVKRIRAQNNIPKIVAVVDQTVSDKVGRQASQMADLLQFHAIEMAEDEMIRKINDLSKLSVEIWLAISSKQRVPDHLPLSVKGVLVDYDKGGSGQSHGAHPGPFRQNWNQLLIRAGGISQKNVGVLSKGWDGIDVASGIEANGKPDAIRMKELTRLFYSQGEKDVDRDET